MAPEIYWLDEEEVCLMHERQIVVYGGSFGIRDKKLLQSAITRPQQVAAYQSPALPIPTIAAYYAIAITQNHPFIDGNKRTALMACLYFLDYNNHHLSAAETSAYTVMMRLSAGTCSDEEFIAWVQHFTSPC